MDIVVVDINPLTLGIETTGGVMSELIPRNSPIPTEQTKPFTTVADDQQSVNIEIFEGERSMSKDNHFLGSFVLTGIPPAPRGIPQIDVTFDIDVNGILNVTAQEKSIGIKKNIIINSKTNRLSTQEIDRMIKEAERFAEQDKKIKDRIDGRNDFESYVYSVKNQLNDNTKPLGRLSIREQTTIEYHVDKQLQWLDANSDAKLEDIIKHKDQFEEIVSEIINEINRRGPNSNDTHSDEL
jgi:molecular chaperone DnaK (HSP70)